MNKMVALTIVAILILSSILAVGLFVIPDDPDYDSDGGGDDSAGGSLPVEVQEKWKKYSDEVNTPEVITTDPGIAKATPTSNLEKLAYLEGLQNFSDSSQGSYTGNTTFDRDNDVDDGGYQDEVTAPSADKDAEESDSALGGGDGGEEREVEEADLVKVIDDKMYILNSYRGLIIVDIKEPENAYIEGQCSVVGYPVEMYVVDFLAIITVRTDYNFWYKYWLMDEEGDGGSEDDTETGTIGTMMYIVNVDDAADPKIVKIVELEGFAVESRRVGHVIYQATNTYGWYNYNNDNKDETIVSSIDFGDPETVGLVDQERFEGSSNQVHASSTAFYVTQPVYEHSEFTFWDDADYYTEVTYLDISDPDGKINKRDTFRAPGYLEDKYQMDEYNKMFRMVTHFWNGIGESKLFIFDVSNPNDVRELGSLLVDDAGSLMATRFAGERAYTIHLPRSIDPLDVLDLSDPKNPKLCDVFEMPGWVTHMEVHGYKIIALGVDDSEGQRNVAVSLFDVSDPYNAEMEDRVRLGGDYAYSSANWEPKALTIDTDHNVVIVPYSSYDREVYKSIYGIQIVSFNLNKGDLELKGSASSDYAIDRTRVVDDYVLATSFRTLQVVDIDIIDTPEVVKVIDLVVNVQDVVPLGDLYIQLSQEYYDTGIQLRTVTSVDDLIALDVAEFEATWAKLFDTGSNVILAINLRSDKDTVAKLYLIEADKTGKITATKLAALPDNVVFMDSYYYYDDYYYMEDFGRSDMAYYPYYESYGSERFALFDDTLVYYHIGEHKSTEWVYDEEAGRSLPTPQERGTDTLYIFDLANLKDVDMYTLELETFSLQGLTTYKNELIVQHRMTGVDIWINNDYYYYTYYYKNYALTIDLDDPKNVKETGEYNVPGNVIGAADNVIFTLSDWYDNEHNVTLNTLTIENGSAKITSAVKVGTGQYSAVMYDSKVYLIKQPYYYYYYYRGYDEESEVNTTLKVIDVSTPDEPVQELSVEIEGYIDIEKIENGHIVVFDSNQNALMIYSTDFDDELVFEAMIFAQGGYENIRVYENSIIVPQGYYPTIKARL